MNTRRETAGQSSRTSLLRGLLISFVLGLLVGALLAALSGLELDDEEERRPDEDVKLGFLSEATTSHARLPYLQ